MTNNQEKQFEGDMIYFCSCFQRLYSVVDLFHCDGSVVMQNVMVLGTQQRRVLTS
jgi:hypothetical protein